MTTGRCSTILRGLSVVFATCVLYAFTMGHSRAEEPSTTQPDFTKRFYLNGGVGLTRIEPESPTDALTVSDNSDSGAHLAFGYDLTRLLSVEGYVADLGTASVDFLGAPAGTVDYRVFGLSVLGYLFNSRSGFVLGDADTNGLFRREGLSLYGRAGIGHMRNKSRQVDSNRDYPTHAAFGVGLEYGLRNGFAFRSELMSMDTDAKYFNVGILKRFGDVREAVVVPPVVPKEIAAADDDTTAVPDEEVVLKAVVPPNVYFQFDRSELSAEAQAKLDVFAESMIGKDVDIGIDGHTDWLAPEQYNMSLSVRRAEAVANYLVGKGMSAESMVVMGYGETRPISNNNTVNGRTLNRRVEIEIR